MAKMKTCCECGRQLSKNEIALCMKLMGVDTEEYYCLPCFAEYLGCEEDDLKVKINEFKEQGCTLFL